MYCGYSYLRGAFRTTSLSLGSEAVVSSGVNKLVRTDSQLLVPPRMAPADGDTLAHLVFALKHEGINLEILSQVLAKLDSSLLQEALDDKPSSAIYRKLGWLYEEFTQKQLNYGRPFGNYVDFLTKIFTLPVQSVRFHAGALFSTVWGTSPIARSFAKRKNSPTRTPNLCSPNLIDTSLRSHPNCYSAPQTGLT